MANRIGFKEFLKKCKPDEYLQLIIDANVLIASRDAKHKDYNSIREFFKSLEDVTTNYTLFTTVTTKSEFLEYYRRKILTEGLLEIYKKSKSEEIVTQKVKQEITNQLRERNRRQTAEVKRQEKNEVHLQLNMIDTTELELEEFSIDANYFKDSEIKSIKKAFRARDVDNEVGWISFCRSVLLQKLHRYEALIDSLCHYLTTRDEVSLKYFSEQSIDWNKATQICGESGLGYSDAMILNMANHTAIKNILTLDYDIVYGGHFSSKDKTFITPTNRLKTYKSALKGIQ